MKFTTGAIEALKPDSARREFYKFEDGPGAVRGLGLRVQVNGTKTFVFQFRTRTGVKRRMSLGDASAVAVADARRAAQQIAAEVALGRDPFADRQGARAAEKAKAERDALTLAVLIDKWRDGSLAKRRESYRAEAVRALRYAFAKHLNKPADALSTKAVEAVIERMQKAGRNGQAAIVPVYGAVAFNWAIKKKLVAENPFRGVERPAIVRRDRVLTGDEIRAVWQATASGSAFDRGLRFLLLTGQRLSEVAGLTWAEISPDRTAWTLPAERAKNAKAHLIPLSEAARNLLPAQRGPDAAIVFPAPRGGVLDFHTAKARLDREAGVTGWRLHDLRRTVATGLQSLGVRLEITEAVLNHTGGARAGIVGIYQRHDYAEEKRTALEAWAVRLGTIVEGRDAPSNVVELKGRAAS